MKKIIIIIIIVVLASLILGFLLQKFTSLKIFSYIKDLFKKISNFPARFYKPTQPENQDKTYSGPPADKNLNIFIRELKFVPSNNAVLVGTKITWYNEDTALHNVTGEGWTSGNIEPGANFSKIFDIPGTYKYQCSLHPQMKGEIIVK